jgi:hypothetical protein
MKIYQVLLLVDFAHTNVHNFLRDPDLHFVLVLSGANIPFFYCTIVQKHVVTQGFLSELLPKTSMHENRGMYVFQNSCHQPGQ